MLRLSVLLLAVVVFISTGGCATQPESRSASAEPANRSHPQLQPEPVPSAAAHPPKIALALGGGAARGFAHVGVVKTLEAHGIVPDIVVGTSAGSVVGVLYAAGYGGYDLQKIAFQMDEATIGDWTLPGRGVIKGELLQNYINRAVQNRPIERLNKLFAAVATDLQTGEMIAFRTGNAGMAVRASSCVPGVFQPVTISGREYVDGGLVSPVPVRAARSLGADIVIAVDISSKPTDGKLKSTLDVLLQTFSIMGQSIAAYELAEADVTIRPGVGTIGSASFNDKHLAILEGEKATLEALSRIRAKIAERRPK